MPAMTLQDNKETKRFGRTEGMTYGQRENYTPCVSGGGGVGIKKIKYIE